MKRKTETKEKKEKEKEKGKGWKHRGTCTLLSFLFLTACARDWIIL